MVSESKVITAAKAKEVSDAHFQDNKVFEIIVAHAARGEYAIKIGRSVLIAAGTKRMQILGYKIDVGKDDLFTVSWDSKDE